MVFQYMLLKVAMMTTARYGGLFIDVVHDVVDDSITAICQARLCPQVRCQPKDGVLADDSFHREASSLIGRLSFGRCTVALGYSGGNRLHVGLHLSDVMLYHIFPSKCEDDIVQEDCLLCCGKHVNVSTLQLLQSSSINIPSPRRVSCAPTSAWSGPCCRTSSVKVMALSKSWYILDFIQPF